VDYRDLLEIKMWLESLAIRRAAECATGEQLDRLIHLGERLCRLAEAGEFSVALDREFHTQLLDCGGSSTLSQLVLSLVDALNDYSASLTGRCPCGSRPCPTTWNWPGRSGKRS
jgi:DNA-binding FadR family transcriptional regulator